MAEEIKLSERVHPLYEDNIDSWELYRDAAIGGETFLNDANLFSHRLEDPEDFDERLERAYYLNFCDTIPNIYNSFIFRNNIERAPDDALEAFRRNADGRGTSISDFIKRVSYFASIFGIVHILVDIPSSKKENISKRDEKEQGLVPYCSIIYPYQLKDWSVDSRGNFRWVLIESVYYNDLDPNVEREEKKHYKLITTEEWRIEDEDGNQVKFDDNTPSNGTNPLGYIPMASMYHKDINDDKIGESLIKDIVYINRAIMNWCSCIDEQIERQTFSQLVIPDDGELAEKDETGEDPLYELSTSSVWTASASSGWPPQFISPDTQSIDVVWKMVGDHVKEIYRMAGLIGGTGDLYVSRSGRAAQMSFQGVNSSLAEKALKCQKAENDISIIALALLGKSEDFEDVKYPVNFDVAGLADEIDSYFKILEKNFSPRLNKTIMKNISRRAVPLATKSVKDEIESEIESSDGIVESTAKRDENVSQEDGNPSSGNISDTHKSKGEMEKEEKQKKRKE